MHITKRKNGVERKFPYCDYEYTPVSDCNFAYLPDKLKVKNNSVGKVTFSSEVPPITIKASVKNKLGD